MDIFFPGKKQLIPGSPPAMITAVGYDTYSSDIMGLASLLTELAKVQRQHGPDSPEVEEFVKQHSADEEFVGLAQISRALRKALAVQPMTRVIRP